MTKIFNKIFKKNLSIVTGSAGRFGKIISNNLASLGSDLILIDKNIKGEKYSLFLEKKYKIKVYFFNLDLTSEKKLIVFSKIIKKKFKKIDLLINNAAFVGDSQDKGWNTEFLKQTNDSWNKALDINLNPCFYLSKIVTPLLKKSKSPSIINIASIYSFLGPDLNLYKNTGIHNPAAYSASKAALVHLTKWLACNLAPRIRVNAISPGGFYSEQPQKFLKRYLKKTPLRRMLSPEDLEGAIIFLASKQSSYITGQNLILDGGISLS
jgi:NAD(P)-dependent dehydrogenase (short-subunit alcohol dehydrogenase family)